MRFYASTTVHFPCGRLLRTDFDAHSLSATQVSTLFPSWNECRKLIQAENHGNPSKSGAVMIDLTTRWENQIGVTVPVSFCNSGPVSAHLLHPGIDTQTSVRRMLMVAWRDIVLAHVSLVSGSKPRSQIDFEIVEPGSCQCKPCPAAASTFSPTRQNVSPGYDASAGITRLARRWPSALVFEPPGHIGKFPRRLCCYKSYLDGWHWKPCIVTYCLYWQYTRQ